MFSISDVSSLGTATRLGVFEHGSPEWHGARRIRLGGSEIAAVIGISKWESRYSLWHRKKGLVSGQAVDKVMSFGTRAESLVLDWFAELHPELAVTTKVGTWAHNERGWQLANPDAFCWATGDGYAGLDRFSIVEAKVADDEWEWGPVRADGYGDSEGVPPYYLAQLRWYLDVFGISTAYLAVLFLRGRELRVYRVDAHAADQKYMRVKGAEFLADVATGVVPALDAHTATYQAVRELHPEIEDREVVLDEGLAERYDLACTVFDIAQRERAEMTTRVADTLGQARYGVVVEPDGTHRTVARRQSRVDGIPYLVRATARKKEVAA